WILAEENAEVRRVLIEGIGYDRIIQELQAKQIDSWQEYALLQIDNADVEPICLLKPTFRTLHCHNRFLRNFVNPTGHFLYTQGGNWTCDRQFNLAKLRKFVV
uniref:DUF6745 domain-containing protein n=1 Tax=Microcoleus sp. OTE_8_concoct_300 TaxID=2964710 RepID=UPI00403F3A8C